MHALGNWPLATVIPHLAATLTGGPVLKAHPIDYVIMGVYFVFVIAIGVITGRGHQTSEDFFLSGRRIPAWITGLAFISANLGALEVLGMASQGYEYGMMTANFYWVGAIPAMVFLGIFMMPFYYGSKVRSVPEYLKKRYNEGTRFINALVFAASTPVLSGVSMYGMGLVFHDLLGWDLSACIWVSAAVVVAYTAMGGLTASIYNEVLQFFLIVLGILPMIFIGIKANGGWHHFVQVIQTTHPGYMDTWKGTGTAVGNPMKIDWMGLVLGLGFVLSFAYWCTDFLVVQRALAAKNMNAARRTPLIAAIPKMFFPFIVILPGLLALPLIPGLIGGDTHPAHSYNNVMPLMMAKFYPAGLLGLGLTALLASFMSGMAGNITAFNTVFTYDIYGAYLAKDKSDRHYLWVGRIITVLGVILSVGTAYWAGSDKSIMDFTQTIFGFVNAPLLAIFLMGMFSRRTTPWGGFWGLVTGVLAAVGLWMCSHFQHTLFPHSDFLKFNSPQAGNFWRAFWAFACGLAATWLVSRATAKKPQEGMVGLVYQLTPKPQEDPALPFWKRPVFLGIVILIATAILNFLFW
ncbi:MAG: sodium:solute symporter family protein [Phycisphaerae bacterium]|nr:sodium:solute symporter family protein [Phycisphaerae bacterium]